MMRTSDQLRTDALMFSIWGVALAAVFLFSGCDGNPAAALPDGPELPNSDDGKIVWPPGQTEPPIEGTVLERGVTIRTAHVSLHLENALKILGHRGEVYFDNETGKVAWPALTCTNPDCAHSGSDKPLVFAFPVPNDGLDEEGNLKVPESLPEADRIARCPTCGHVEWVVSYELPEVTRKRQELDQELINSRKALRAAGGRQMPNGYRSVAEIIKERATMPDLFLLVNE